MMGQGVMNLLMTGTPLAMMAHHHTFADTAFVIQWHVVGMFLPGFFSGTLVQRWGERTVIALGIALNLLAVVAAALDVGVPNFLLAMTLNGIGWNFMFVAGSTLVTKAYAPAERSRTQAANDFMVFGTAALTSLSSGQLLHHKGWQVVLVTAVVMLLAALVGSLWRASHAGPRSRLRPRRRPRRPARHPGLDRRTDGPPRRSRQRAERPYRYRGRAECLSQGSVMTDGRQFPASTDTTASKMLRTGGREYHSLRKAGS